MFKVESKISAKGIVSVRLLSSSGKPVAAAVFPVNLIDEIGAALMMSREKLEADGVLKPSPLECRVPASETWN